MIHSLVADIQHLVTKKDGWFHENLASAFSNEVRTRLSASFNRPDTKPTLRLSQMGPKCPSALWHSIHSPGEAERLPPWAEIKFAFGHIIEALAISLAKAAGHEVTGEQDEIVVDGIVGHRDCVIDGCIVDVKSASSPSFKKFKDRSIAQKDDFGYLDQLDGYAVGSLVDPLVRIKDKAYLLAIDKQLGHMCLYEHKVRHEHILQRIQEYKEVVNKANAPGCTCKSVKDGESGNLRLDTKASYSPQKFSCNPGIRVFLYHDGPRYLTKVMRKPDVPEINRYGVLIHQ